MHAFGPTQVSALREKIDMLNRDEHCTGIIIQAPVETTPAVRMAELTELVDPRKDVDGLHPTNMGRLAMRSGRPWFYPCTPLGIMLLCRYYGVELAGRRVAMLGRSEIVGLPLSLLLTRLDATVTLCHQYSPDAAAIARESDMVIAATGRARLVKPHWIKPGATLIDVGINRVAGSVGIVGDIDPACRHMADAMTPVPGGVGPMTVAALAYNLLNAALCRQGCAPLDEHPR